MVATPRTTPQGVSDAVSHFNIIKFKTKIFFKDNSERDQHVFMRAKKDAVESYGKKDQSCTALAMLSIAFSPRTQGRY
jgi:hypothetical protein